MICGIVYDRPKIAYFHGMSRVTATVRDESGSLSLCWFNEPWMIQQLPTGERIMLYGRVRNRDGRWQMTNPVIVRDPGWIPIYRAVEGLPAKSFREMIREALTAVETICPETLPMTIRKRFRLTGLSVALKQAHFPDSLEELKAARRRLSFESMLMYLMRVSMQGRQHPAGYVMKLSEEEPLRFWQAMAFPPTGAQKRVLEEILADLKQDRAMSRMVQGDVGCGKTVLAFGSIYMSWRAGFQSAMMAPTEILARQHYENAVEQLQSFGIRCRLLTGSTKAKERREILKELMDGTCQAVFGTHALISDGVTYRKLGLVITDEQHRFGVLQRSRLQEKGISGMGDGTDSIHSRSPHVLVMSATPIPRTLALILYGDLDLSVVNEMPPGRRPVKTRIVPPAKRGDMYRFLRETVKKGQQAYIVCPLVEESESLEDVKNAKGLYEELNKTELSGLRVGLTWGGQKPEEKEKTLRAFAKGESDVLIATTVIEVGVNVPNATVMIIENAERFGLSQLHQLRGRVGRGSAESWCFLLSGAKEKLRILCETTDGFLVAKKDLEMRGPGDLMGTRQSGETLSGFLPDGDVQLLDEAMQAVRALENEPELEKERLVIEELAERYFNHQRIAIALN